MIDKTHPFFPVFFFNEIQGKDFQYIDNALSGMTDDEVKNLMSYASEMYGNIPLETLGLKDLAISLNRCFPSIFTECGGNSFMDLLSNI